MERRSTIGKLTLPIISFDISEFALRCREGLALRDMRGLYWRSQYLTDVFHDIIHEGLFESPWTRG